MDLISREAIMKLTKEMYLEIANNECDVHTISDCTSYVASKCREYVDEHIRRKDIPSAFEGMTNGEVFLSIFPCDEVHINGLQEGCVHFSMKSNPDSMDCFDLKWWNAPYKGVSE